MAAVVAVKMELAQPPSMMDKQMKAKTKSEKKSESPAKETSPATAQPTQSIEGKYGNEGERLSHKILLYGVIVMMNLSFAENVNVLRALCCLYAPSEVSPGKLSSIT